MINPSNPKTRKDEWLTPPEIIRALGPFNLDPCAPVVHSVLFLAGRLSFYGTDGLASKFRAEAPSVLLAYSDFDSEQLSQSGIPGSHVWLRVEKTFLIERPEGTWRIIVRIAMRNLGNRAGLSDLYTEVQMIAPIKVRLNGHFKAKIRQVARKYLTRIKKGEYSC
jgi:hypothetical protein